METGVDKTSCITRTITVHDQIIPYSIMRWRSLRKRPLHETPRKCGRNRLREAKSVSFSHLTKHRLIKPLQPFLPETHLRHRSRYTALPPKIALKLPISG